MTATLGFEHPRQAAAGAVIMAALSARRIGSAATDTAALYVTDGAMLHDGHTLHAVDVTAAAATILDRLIHDMSHVFGLDPDRSLAGIGRWVESAAQAVR